MTRPSHREDEPVSRYDGARVTPWERMSREAEEQLERQCAELARACGWTALAEAYETIVEREDGVRESVMIMRGETKR